MKFLGLVSLGAAWGYSLCCLNEHFDLLVPHSVVVSLLIIMGMILTALAEHLE